MLAAAERELQPVYAAAMEPVYAADGSVSWVESAQQQQQQQQQPQPAYAHAGGADFYAAEFADAASYGASYGQQHAFVAAAASVQPEALAVSATGSGDASAAGYDDIFGSGQQAHYNSPAYEQLFAAGEPFNAAPVAAAASLYGQQQQQQQQGEQGYAAASFASEAYAADSYRQLSGAGEAAAAVAAEQQQQAAAFAAEQQLLQQEQQAAAFAAEQLLLQQQEQEAAAAATAAVAAAAALETEYHAPAAASSSGAAIAAPQRSALPALARALVSVRRTARLLRSKGLDAVNLNRHLDALQQEYQAAGPSASGKGGRWQRKREESVLAAGERQRSLTDVRYELQVCAQMCQYLGDPSHPDLLVADKRLAAAAGILATLPSVLPSFGV